MFELFVKNNTKGRDGEISFEEAFERYIQNEWSS